MDNEYVKQLCQLPRRVLCVITGVAALKNEGVVTVHTTWKAEEEFKAGKVKQHIGLNMVHFYRL